jgi:DNA-binding transcriptional ArsR family regulator
MVQYSHQRLDASFGALSDATRRRILVRLGRGDASITELAEKFEMTLTGMKKHVSVLEDAGLVTTEKVGRVRTCTLGPRRLDDATEWMTKYREMLEERLDHLAAFLERTEGDDR